MDFNILKILYNYVKLFGFLFCVIYHCNVTIALEVHLLSIKLIIRHVLKCEKKLAFFHVNPYYLVLAYLIILRLKIKCHIKITLMDNLKG